MRGLLLVLAVARVFCVEADSVVEERAFDCMKCTVEDGYVSDEAQATCIWQDTECSAADPSECLRYEERLQAWCLRAVENGAGFDDLDCNHCTRFESAPVRQQCLTLIDPATCGLDSCLAMAGTDKILQSPTNSEFSSEATSLDSSFFCFARMVFAKKAFEKEYLEYSRKKGKFAMPPGYDEVGEWTEAQKKQCSNYTMLNGTDPFELCSEEYCREASGGDTGCGVEPQFLVADGSIGKFHACNCAGCGSCDGPKGIGSYRLPKDSLNSTGSPNFEQEHDWENSTYQTPDRGTAVAHSSIKCLDNFITIMTELADNSTSPFYEMMMGKSQETYYKIFNLCLETALEDLTVANCQRFVMRSYPGFVFKQSFIDNIQYLKDHRAHVTCFKYAERHANGGHMEDCNFFESGLVKWNGTSVSMGGNSVYSNNKYPEGLLRCWNIATTGFSIESCAEFYNTGDTTKNSFLRRGASECLRRVPTGSRGSNNQNEHIPLDLSGISTSADERKESLGQDGAYFNSIAPLQGKGSWSGAKYDQKQTKKYWSGKQTGAERVGIQMSEGLISNNACSACAKFKVGSNFPDQVVEGSKYTIKLRGRCLDMHDPLDCTPKICTEYNLSHKNQLKCLKYAARGEGFFTASDCAMTMSKDGVPEEWQNSTGFADCVGSDCDVFVANSAAISFCLANTCQDNQKATFELNIEMKMGNKDPVKKAPSILHCSDFTRLSCDDYKRVLMEANYDEMFYESEYARLLQNCPLACGRCSSAEGKCDLVCERVTSKEECDNTDNELYYIRDGNGQGPFSYISTPAQVDMVGTGWGQFYRAIGASWKTTEHFDIYDDTNSKNHVGYGCIFTPNPLHNSTGGCPSGYHYSPLDVADGTQNVQVSTNNGYVESIDLCAGKCDAQESCKMFEYKFPTDDTATSGICKLSSGSLNSDSQVLTYKSCVQGPTSDDWPGLDFAYKCQEPEPAVCDQEGEVFRMPTDRCSDAEGPSSVRKQFEDLCNVDPTFWFPASPWRLSTGHSIYRYIGGPKQTDGKQTEWTKGREMAHIDLKRVAARERMGTGMSRTAPTDAEERAMGGERERELNVWEYSRSGSNHSNTWTGRQRPVSLGLYTASPSSSWESDDRSSPGCGNVKVGGEMCSCAGTNGCPDTPDNGGQGTQSTIDECFSFPSSESRRLCLAHARVPIGYTFPPIFGGVHDPRDGGGPSIFDPASMPLLVSPLPQPSSSRCMDLLATCTSATDSCSDDIHSTVERLKCEMEGPGCSLEDHLHGNDLLNMIADLDSDFKTCLHAVPGQFTLASCAELPTRFWSVCLARLAATTDFCPASYGMIKDGGLPVPRECNNWDDTSRLQTFERSMMKLELDLDILVDPAYILVEELLQTLTDACAAVMGPVIDELLARETKNWASQRRALHGNGTTETVVGVETHLVYDMQFKPCHMPLSCRDCAKFAPTGPRSSRTGSVDAMSQCLSLVKRSHGKCGFAECYVGDSPAWTYYPKPEYDPDTSQDPTTRQGARGRLVEAPWVNVTHQCLALSEGISEDRSEQILNGEENPEAWVNSEKGCQLCIAFDTDDSIQADCISRSNLTCTVPICSQMREGVHSHCYRNIFGNQDCECEDLWSSAQDGVNCKAQESCPAKGCDGDLPWCVTVLPCRTEQPQFGGGWSYCKGKKKVKWPY